MVQLVAGLYGHAYDAELVNPETAEVTPLGAVTGDAEGRWPVPPVPVFRDWLLVLERRPWAPEGDGGFSRGLMPRIPYRVRRIPFRIP